MSDHLKRLVAPDSWHIDKKTTKFVTKTAPGPHTGEAMPVAVWLKDHAGLARNIKEVKQIIGQRDIIVNGRPCRDHRLGLGAFDIIAIPKVGKYYRIQLSKQGRLVSIEIPEETSKTRLCKVRDKTIIPGGKVQLNLLYGANILADNTYRPKDTVVLTLGDAKTGEDRFRIVEHYPFEVGGMAMIIAGRHSGRIGRIVDITVTPSSSPNRVILEVPGTNERFDTIDEYVFMIGRGSLEGPATWGFEA